MTSEPISPGGRIGFGPEKNDERTQFTIDHRLRTAQVRLTRRHTLLSLHPLRCVEFRLIRRHTLSPIAPRPWRLWCLERSEKVCAPSEAHAGSELPVITAMSLRRFVILPTVADHTNPKREF